MLLIQHFSTTPSKLKTQIWSLTLIMSDKWVICSTRNTGCAIVMKCRAKFESGILYWFCGIIPFYSILKHQILCACTHSVWWANLPWIGPTFRSHYCRDKWAETCSKGNLVELSLHKWRADSGCYLVFRFYWFTHYWISYYCSSVLQNPMRNKVKSWHCVNINQFTKLADSQPYTLNTVNHL